MPTSGSATLRAAKMENASRACLSQRYWRPSAEYSGSMAVMRAPTATPARKITLGDVSVEEAQ
jgi:hypothetical protein